VISIAIIIKVTLVVILAAHQVGNIEALALAAATKMPAVAAVAAVAATVVRGARYPRRKYCRVCRGRSW
jgi:hypothetical protein